MASRELLEFLRRGENKSTLSQIILPFCSDTSGERNPVALLTGNINLKANLRKDGKLVSFEEELKKLEAEIENLKVTKGQIVDLSAEMKKLQIETDEADEKEIKIKEEWTPEDEILFKSRKERKIVAKPVQPMKQESKSLSSDIEELLRLAEMEEEEEEAVENGYKSKVKEIKKVVMEQNSKVSGSTLKELPKLKLPKITATNPLIGDIVEREPEVITKPVKLATVPDEVSNRIILNDLKKIDLKSSVSSHEQEIEDVQSSQLKKPSRFSLRKQ